MSWEDIENAMQAAVTKASRFPSGQVVWSYQNINEQSLPHIVINFGGEQILGIDRVAISQNLSRPNGQEMKQEVRGVREVPFEISVFTTETTGTNAARRVAELIRSRMRLPDVRYSLRKVGVSPFDPGGVHWIPDIPNTAFRGRAMCSIRCYVPASDCEEYTGYIARITGVIHPTGFASTSYGATGLAFDSALGIV